MSDFVLKIFPTENVSVNKTETLKQALIEKSFLNGQTIDFYGEEFLAPGDAFCDFFEFEDKASALNSFKSDVRIKILADGYGVKMEEGDEEPEFIDRKNVIEIWNVDGNYVKWDKITQLAQEATGDYYKGEWELV